MMGKKVAVLLLCLLVSTSAFATITLPWRTNEYGTYQAWTFENPDNQTDVSQGARTQWVSVPEDDQNPYGDPVAHISVGSKCVGTAMQMGWNLGDTSTQRVGIYYGHDPRTIDTMGAGLTIRLGIPNTPVEDLIKIVQIEIVYAGYITGETLHVMRRKIAVVR